MIENITPQMLATEPHGGSSEQTMPYYGAGSYSPNSSLMPSVSALMTWLQGLQRAGQPIPPMATHLLNLHQMMINKPETGYNPDTTQNQKYTSYTI